MDAERKIAQLIGAGIEIKDEMVGDQRINYAVAGSGPAVLLLHGANIGWGQWYLNIAEFARYFKVYAIDLPGAGGSSKMAFHAFDLERDFVEAVDGFIRQQGLSKIHIVGHSLGGWIALKLAIREAPYLDKMVVVDSMGFTDYMPWKYRLVSFRWFAVLLSKTVMKPTKKKMRNFLAGVMYDTSTLKDEFVEYFHESIHRERLSHPLLLINRLSGFFKISKELFLLDQLSTIQHPMLIIMGEKDTLIPLIRASQGIRFIPGAQLEIFLNTGHSPAVEKSKDFNELVINFLHL